MTEISFNDDQGPLLLELLGIQRGVRPKVRVSFASPITAPGWACQSHAFAAAVRGAEEGLSVVVGGRGAQQERPVWLHVPS